MSLLCANEGYPAEPPKAPVPKSSYLPVVYRYADAMLEHGRDSYGPQKTGLLLSALDRTSLSPLTNRPPAPAGIREEDRVGTSDAPLAGANPWHDQNLLRLLYTLSELSGKAHYRQAADAELKWFLENARAARTALLPWGPRMSWDVMTDQPTPKDQNAAFFRPWVLWDRCFEFAPKASKAFALQPGQNQNTNHNKVTSGPMDFPRHGGFYIRTWAVAYAHTKDEAFLERIEMLLGQLEKRRQSQTRGNEPFASEKNTGAASPLSAGIDCDGAAHRVPEALASRLREFASREDAVFLSLPHGLKSSGGFVEALDETTGKPSAKTTSLWSARHGGTTTAQVGMMCVSRYDNTGNVGYRALILAAADAYQNSQPGGDEDAWPRTFGHAISLQIAAWRHTAKPAYLESARRIADIAVEKFWGTNTLPKASFKTEHYETITGADTLALALVELHLNILHITAVRCPPNTIDR